MAKRNNEDDTRGPFEEHPLFPLDEGGKPFEVAFISMARKEDGGMVWIPQIFPATELTNTNQILERFGGGVYELWARGASVVHVGQPGNVTKKRILTLPGRPKLIDPSNATIREEINAGIRPNPADVKAAAPQGLAGDSAVLIAIMQMGQTAAQAAAAQNQQFMALMMQMMSEGKKEAAESSRMMMQMFTQMTTSQQQSMMQMLPLLVSTKGGGPAEIEQYLGLFQKMGFGKTEVPKEEGDEGTDVDVGQMVGHLATIVQGAPAALSALKEMGPGNGQVALPVAASEAPPGSAASVLQGRG